MTVAYTTGQGINLTATFTVSGVATDPTTVIFKVLDPDDVLTTYTYGVDAELTKSATGVYILALTVTKANTWYYKAIGTGTASAAAEGSFVGQYSQIN